MNSLHYKKYEGSASLITVVLLTAILIITGLTVVFMSIDLQKNNLAYKSKVEVKVTAKSCFEESMNVVKDNLTYTGTFNFVENGHSCVSTITSLGAGISEIEVVATDTVFTYKETHQIDVSQYPPKVLE
jgi:hypothetical protein